MAKVSFSKLGLSKNNTIKNFEYNGQNIEVKQYLPINDKATLVLVPLAKCCRKCSLWSGSRRLP